MSSSILSNRWVVYYEVENRQKRVFRDISVTPTVTDTVNALYSALQDLFDELPQMDDGIPISAQTPTEYTIGIIDTGDKDPWFLDRQSAEYLTGGAIKTASWKRVQDSNTGVLKVPRTGTNIVAADVSYDIVGADGDTGTLLDVQGSYLWIRPDSSAIANSFDNTSQNLTCNAHTDAQNGAPLTGEALWANIYSLGTIEAKTHLYVYQNGSNLIAFKGSSDWWGDGHIDILVLVKEVDVLVDEAYTTVLARQYSKTADYYIVGLSAGGRNPIPLSTGADLNNATGYRKFTGSAGSGIFQVGEEIYKSGTNKRAMVTAVAGTEAAPQLTYYLIGDPITDFVDTDAVTGLTSNATCTAGAPANVGPAALSGLSIVHAADETFDINENGVHENYSIKINCNNTALASVYEWAKYLTRRGDVNTGNTDGLAGEYYIGSDYRVGYTSVGAGSIAEGDIVQQPKTGTATAKGTVLAHNATDKVLILRSSRGAFNNTDDIGKDGSNYVTGPTCTTISPIKACPYGTFAGGVFFCAPGVVLNGVPTADAKNFQLKDDGGNVVNPPNKVSVTVTNTRALDKIAVFRLTGTGGTIKKDEYTATVQAIGGTAAVVSSSITSDTPGRTAGGVLRLVDASPTEEFRVRFASWTGSSFLLSSYLAGTMGAGTDGTVVVCGGAFLSGSVGDIIRNITRSAITYIGSITNIGTVRVLPSVSGQVSGDSFEMNTLPVATGTLDKVYVPFLDAYEKVGSDSVPGSESTTITYPGSNIPVRVRARKAGSIVPFEGDSSILATGLSYSVIRTPDTIYA